MYCNKIVRYHVISFSLILFWYLFSVPVEGTSEKPDEDSDSINADLVSSLPSMYSRRIGVRNLKALQMYPDDCASNSAFRPSRPVVNSMIPDSPHTIGDDSSTAVSHHTTVGNA